MAVPSDPNIPFDFDAGVFRESIRFVYTMAAPTVLADQITFFTAPQLVYNTPVDAEDVPFDPAATVTRVQSVGVQVPCAVEYLDVEGQAIVFGTVTPSKVVVTLLDEDYQRVKDVSYVVIAGERYNYRRTEPPSGLFDCGLYVIHFLAENEV